MAAGFTVRASVLESGSGRVSQLQSDCEQVASAVTATLDALAGAAGDAGVQHAAEGVAKAATEGFLNAAAGYQHTAASLTQNAQGYRQAEDKNTASVRSIRMPAPPVGARG